MLVIKRFSRRKKVFRERKKSRKIHAKRSVSLRCETGEKKLDEVDFISQRVELVSRVPKTMTKSRVEFNLRIGRRMDQRMERSFGCGLEQDIDGDNQDDSKKRLVMVNEEGWMS
ncbi:hypothetical protein Tco_1484298 [Tanacetum coccineum]